jgi:DNA-directed RNA polymerase subunit RPC12/RpoP
MSIRFRCEQCGHPIDVDDRYGGKHGTCKHCGHRLLIPEPGEEVPGPSLRLRPLDADEPSGVPAHLLAPQSPLTVRPAEEDPRPRPAAISDPDEPPASGRGRGADYSVLDPHRLTEAHSSSGPPPLWRIFPSLTARFAASYFRMFRDWLYVVSLVFLVVALLGYLFHAKVVLHLGAAGVIASNIGMLCVGTAYLVTLPFKESLAHGLANLLIPFYAIYYWTTRWPRMRTPVSKTLGSFLPIFLVGLAYVVYEEGPVVESMIEKEIPALEKSLEEGETKVDETLRPIQRRVGPLLGPSEKTSGSSTSEEGRGPR